MKICNKIFTLISDVYDAIKGLWSMLGVVFRKIVDFFGSIYDFKQIAMIKDNLH